MVCSICNSQSHRANKCEDRIVRMWGRRLMLFWLGDPRLQNEAFRRNATDEQVMEWAQDNRLGIAGWKRFWNKLDEILADTSIAWRPSYVNFIRPFPQTPRAFKERIANYTRMNMHSLLHHLLPPVPQPALPIKLQMVPDDSEFFEETDCVCCLNPLNQDNTVSFDCNHVTCTLCAPKVIKMVASNCPTCREKISTIKFTRNLSPELFCTLFSSL